MIDNIFINTIDKNVISGNLLGKITDHMPNFIIINDIIPQKRKLKKKIRSYVNFDPIKFNQEVGNIELMTLIINEDINDSYNTFHKKFIEILDSHAPYRTMSIKEIKWSRKPWITKGIQKSVTSKNIYYGKYLRTKSKHWYEK